MIGEADDDRDSKGHEYDRDSGLHVGYDSQFRFPQYAPDRWMPGVIGLIMSVDPIAVSTRALADIEDVAIATVMAGEDLHLEFGLGDYGRQFRPILGLVAERLDALL